MLQEQLKEMIDKRDVVIENIGLHRRRLIELETEEQSLTRAIIALNKHMIKLGCRGECGKGVESGG